MLSYQSRDSMQGTRTPRAKLFQLLDELDQTAGEFITVYLTQNTLQAPSSRLQPRSLVDSRLRDVSTIVEDEAVQRDARRYGTGVVVFYSPITVYAVIPALPVREDRAVEGVPNTAPLRQMLGDTNRVALVLVTWGGYVAALFQGMQRKHSRKGTGHIHPLHKKGGSSQARFQRRTEEQRRQFLKRVGARVDAELQGEAVDHVFFGGNRLILKPLTDHSLFLRQAATILMQRILNVERADQEALDSAIEDAYTSIVLRP